MTPPTLGRDEGEDAGGEGAAMKVEGATATITFHRPASRNALRLADWLAIPQLLAAAERDRAVSVILLRGADGRFGSGNDIAEVAALRHDTALARTFGRAMGDATAAVEDASKPVVAAIEGVCYGASVALALAADLRVAADTAVFAITPAKLGALYLRSDLHRLAGAVGQAWARRLIFTADPIDAATARDIGLIDDVRPDTEFGARLQALATTIGAGSPFSLRRSKEMLRDIDLGRAAPETEESLSWFVEATRGPDFAEGVAAFLAKRPARFS